MLLVGSRARGDQDVDSDVDFELIVRGGHVCELVFYRDDLRCEVVVRPERLIGRALRYDPFEVERLADAIAVGALEPEVEVLCRLAADARPLVRPEPSAVEIFLWTRRIRGALARANRTNDLASRVTNRAEAMRFALQLRFALAGRYVPRGRAIGNALRAIDTSAAHRLDAFCASIAQPSAPEDFFTDLLRAVGSPSHREYSHSYVK